MIACDPIECRNSLRAFVRAAWHIVEPGRPLVWNWHLDAICKHLQAWYDGTLRQWVITIPPGTTKSRLVCVYFIAWVWLKDPSRKFLCISNGEKQAEATSIECRKIIESDWYRRTFGVEWDIEADQNTKRNFKNDQGGHRQAFGIGSIITGEKGDFIIVDDANDAEQVFSAAERTRVVRKYDNAIWDRLIDLNTCRRLVVGQRTHVDDLIGHLLRQGGYFELRIPEEFNPANRFTSPIGWTDPRTKKGQLLRPKQFTAKMARDYRRSKLLTYQAKHLQEPRSKEGIRFKMAWFERRWVWDDDRTHILLTDHRGTYRFHSVTGVRARFGTADAAASAKSSADPTAICTWILTERHDLVWLSCRREWKEIPDQPALLAEEYARNLMQWVCVEAVFANVALYQFAQRTAMNVRPVSPRVGGRMVDKLARAVPSIILAESGKIWLPDPLVAEELGFPLDDVTEELAAFTGDDKVDRHDDLIDNLSYATAERSRYVDPEAGDAPLVIPPPLPSGPTARPERNPAQRTGPTVMTPGGHWSGRR